MKCFCNYLRQKLNNKIEMNFIEIQCDYIIFISCFIIKWKFPYILLEFRNINLVKLPLCEKDLMEWTTLFSVTKFYGNSVNSN